MRSRTIVSLLFLYSALCIYNTESRRIRVRPQEEEPEDTQVHYYSAEPQDDNQQQHVVYVSSADQYNGLYGQPTAASRASQDEYTPRHKPSVAILARTKEPAKAPPVQTIRNYNKVNDDGSFTFGYEAADGSFKEETRGTDCVVRGKYGYVDPDGNKREFTYVSGNPCDPNAPKDEQEESGEPESNERDNGPANYPTRPIQRARPIGVTPAPKPVTLFQNNYDQGEEEQPEPEQVLRQQPIRRPTAYITRPQYIQSSEDTSSAYQRAQHFASTTPASLIYSRHSLQPVSITPRPITSSTASQTQLPATTYRPQLLQVAVTPRPSLLYTKGLSSAASTAATPTRGNIDFDAEFQRYQQHRFQTDNHIASPTPSSFAKTTPKQSKESGNSGQIYSSALVYDPSTGQYNTQLYQTLPQTQGDFSLNHRIQPYVHQPQRPQTVNIQQLQAQSPLYTSHLRPQPNAQQAYQQQQAETQFQNSAQLYAQQQKARALQQQQQQRQPAQQFYYIQPQGEQEGGHLSAFLRGHNIQF